MQKNNCHNIALMLLLLLPANARAQWSFSISCRGYTETYTSPITGKTSVYNHPGSTDTFYLSSQSECESARIDYLGRTASTADCNATPCIYTGGGEVAQNMMGIRSIGTYTPNPANEVRDWAEEHREIMKLIGGAGETPAVRVVSTGDSKYDKERESNLETLPERPKNKDGGFEIDWDYLESLNDIPTPTQRTIPQNFAEFFSYGKPSYYDDDSDEDTPSQDDEIESSNGMVDLCGNVADVAKGTLTDFTKTAVSLRSGVAGAAISLYDSVTRGLDVYNHVMHLKDNSFEAIRKMLRTGDSRYLDDFGSKAKDESEEMAVRETHKATKSATVKTAIEWQKIGFFKSLGNH